MVFNKKTRGRAFQNSVKISTRVILSSALIFIAIIPALIINIIYYSRERGFITSQLEQYNTQIISKVGEQINLILTQVETINYELISMAGEFSILDIDPGKHSISSLERLKFYESMMQSIRRTVPEVHDVYLIDMDGYVYSSKWDSNKEKLLQKEWIKGYVPVDHWTIIPAHIADYYMLGMNTNEQVISFIKPVIGWSRPDKLDGLIQIDIKYSTIKTLLESASTGGNSQIFLYDDSGSIIYCSEGSLQGKSLKDVAGLNFTAEAVADSNNVWYDKDNIVITNTLPSMNWHIAAVIPLRESLSKMEEAKSIVGFITSISVLFSLLTGILLSSAITRPLNRVIKKMDKVKIDEINLEKIQINSINRDLTVLTDSYNIMVEKIGILMNNIIRKEREKKNAELQMLQAQINPHFLYNTLNTIKWMALMENSHKIADQIVALVSILEFCCKNHDSIIPVKEELKVLNDYISIQKARYNSAIRIVFDIEDSLYGFYMLKFTLQPSVENAIIHGFTKIKEDCLITIRGREYEDRIVFEVEDNGVGMDNDMLKNMTGLGVRNVNERIKLYFGEKFGQVIESKLGIGTKVTITLPKISSVAEGDANVQAFSCR